MPTNHFSDLFNGSAGTQLTAHTPDLGTSWTLAVGNATAPALDGGGGLDASTTGSYNHYRANATVPSANYTVEARIRIVSTAATGFFIGARVTSTPSSFDGYYFGFWGPYSGFRIFTTQGGNGSIGSGGSLPSVGTHTLKLDVNGSAIKGYLDGVLVISVTNATYTGAGTGGMVFFPNGTGDVIVEEFTVYTGGGDVAAGTPALIGVSNTTASLKISAPTGGTSPFTYQWHRSTSNGFTPGVGTAISGATALRLNDSGLTANQTYYYVCVVTDSTSPTPGTAASTQLTVTTRNDTEFAPNHASIKWTPKTWKTDATRSITNCWNAGVRFNVSGTSKITLVFNNTTFAGVQPPKFSYSVDGGPLVTITLGSDLYACDITGLNSGVGHTFIGYYSSHPDGTNNYTDDYWTSPAVQVSILKVALTNGGSLAAPTVPARKVALLGDSIFRAYYDAGIVTGDAALSCAAVAGCGLGHGGVIGMAGTGWVVAGGNGVPSFASWCFNYFSGAARSFSDFGADDIIIVGLGSNDYTQLDATITAAVNAWFTAIRADAPLPWVFVARPPSGAKWSAIKAATPPDAKVQFLEVDASVTWGVPAFGSTGSATGQTVDGAHLTRQAHAAYGAALVQLVQAAIGGTGGSGGGSGTLGVRACTF